jgi:hypothetical protein
MTNPRELHERPAADEAAKTEDSKYPLNHYVRPLKQITIRIFRPGGKKSKTHLYRAPNGKAFTETGLASLLEQTITNIETHLPDEDYAMRQVGRGAFNFVWMGKKEAA